MTIKYPVYTPINFDFDHERIETEIDKIPDSFFGHSSTWRVDGEYKPETYDNFQIETYEDNLNVSYITRGDTINDYVYVEKKYTAWKSLSLTHIPQIERSKTHNSEYIDGKFIRYRCEYPKWENRDDLKTYLPYTFYVINSLPFEFLNLARICVLEPPNFGPVHTDEQSENFRLGGFTTINLTINDGGVPLLMKYNNEIIELRNKCYQLDNSFPHGVPKVESKRITITVDGYGLIL
ncbi:MAG: hypothetical protein WC284_15355 [Candidimonas sp.]